MATDKTALRNLVPVLRDDVNAALLAVAKKHGLASLIAGNATFDPEAGCITFKLEAVAEGAIGKEGALYNQLRAFEGLPALGFEFTSGGAQHRVVGTNSTGSKIITEAPNGKRYLFPLVLFKSMVARVGAVRSSEAVAS